MKGFITKINPNNKQRTRFLQHAGTARHAYNWGLGKCLEIMHEGGKLPSSKDLHKLLNHLVKPENKWYYESSKCAPQQALRDLVDGGFGNFWKEHEKHKNLPMKKKYKNKSLLKYHNGELKKLTLEHELGFPNFKKKGVKDSFFLEYGTHYVVQIKGNKIKIPKIGWIKTHEELPTNMVGKSIHISRQADDWFISFMVEEIHFKNENTAQTGIDLGIKTLATLANGDKWENPKAYKQYKKKLCKLQRKLSRQYEYAKIN